MSGENGSRLQSNFFDTYRIYDVVLGVYLLKEQRDKIHSERLNNQSTMNKLVEVRSFLDDQTREIEEYKDQLVRNLVDRIMVFNDHLGIKFRTGAEIEIYTANE